MTQRGVSLCVIGSLALAWASWARGEGPAPRRPDLRSAPALDAPASFTATRASALEVRTAAGEPATGVRLWSASAHARALDPGDAQQLGEADARGEIPWPEVLLAADPTRELVVTGPGLRSATLPRGAAGGLVVRLAPAHRLRFRCRTIAGTPLAGVRVGLGRSMTASDVFDATPGWAPGGDPRDALHVAATGEDGVAVLDGLGAMRYAVQVSHPHFALLHGVEEATVDAPGDDVQLTFAPMVGCVIEPPAGLTVRASTLDLMGVPTPATRSSRLAVEEVQRRLRLAHPGCFVHVVLQRPTAETVEGRGKALVGDRWAEFAVVLRPLPRVQPEPLVCETGRMHPTEPPGELVLTGSGSEHALACGLHAVHQTGLACHVPFPASGPLRLPPGDYLLDSTNPLAKVRLHRTTFTIRPGERTEHEFRLGDARMVRLRLRTPHGLPSGRTGLELRRGDEVLGHAMCLGADAFVLAPRVPCELIVRAFGYATATVAIPAEPEATLTPLALELDHAQ